MHIELTDKVTTAESGSVEAVSKGQNKCTKQQNCLCE